MAEEMVKVGTYRYFKAAMDQEVRNVTQGFVRMGYLLKVARDTDILAESGYKTVAEFAAAEYGMNETYVSRFIGINDRYAEGGYSDRLQEKYQGYGMSLLAEMLTLPESIADAVPQGITRKEIREIKKEYEAEQKITPMEVLMEGQPEGAEDLGVPALAMRKYFYEHREKFAELAPVIAREEYSDSSVERLMDVLAPSGVAVLMARVPGIGRLMVSIRGKDQDVEVQNVRSLEKESCTWVELLYGLKLICKGADLSEPERAWEQIYGETYRAEEPQKPDQNAGKPEREQAKPDQDEKEQNEATREQEAERKEDDKGEELADGPEGAGAESHKETSEGERVPEKTAEEPAEEEAEKPGNAPAQESAGDEVNTESNSDQKTLYDQCKECRFHYPESPAKELAYGAVCDDCDDAEHFQPIPEDLSREEKENAEQASEEPKEEKSGEQATEEPETQIPGQDSIMNHPEYLPEGMDPEPTQAAVDGEPVHAQVEPTEEQVKEEALAHLSMIQGNIGIENYRKAREQGEHLLDVLKCLEGYRP